MLTACDSGLVCVLKCGVCPVAVVEGETVGESVLGDGSIHEYRMCHISVGCDETSDIRLGMNTVVKMETTPDSNRTCPVHGARK